MGQPAAHMNDSATATDMHVVLVPSPSGAVPTPLPHPFAGVLQMGLSTNVMIDGQPAAMVNSIALNTPPHIPQGGPFQRPPSNQGKVLLGSLTVLVNGQGAARVGDTVMTCNDPADLPVGTITSGSTGVLIG